MFRFLSNPAVVAAVLMTLAMAPVVADVAGSPRPAIPYADAPVPDMTISPSVWGVP